MTMTLYEILGVDPSADATAIKSAYRRLAAKSHPDTGGSAALFRMVQEAHAVLSNPGRRLEYDRTIGVNASARTAEQLAREEYAQAQSAYVALSSTYNGDGARVWGSASQTQASWADYPRLYGALARLDQEFNRCLAEYPWPGPIAALIDRLVQAVAAEAGLYFRCSLLPGDERHLSALMAPIDAAEVDAQNAARAVRVALSLPIEAD